MNIDEKIVNQVLSTCGDLEEVLNNKLLSEFIKIHRADPKYNHLKLKQEVLAVTSLFLTKKKYSLYIVNKEGKNVSEYDVKGMILRRSNFPQYSKDKINTLLDMILKVEKINISEIKEYIIETEKEVVKLCQEGSKLIAGSVTYSKELEDYKGIPYQVIGMELWNLLEFRYFVPSVKGYLFRILGVDEFKAPERVLKNINKITSKNNHIVIPYETEKLPDYYIIDLKAQKKFVWDDRVSEVLSVLVSNKIIKSDNLFE